MPDSHMFWDPNGFCPPGSPPASDQPLLADFRRAEAAWTKTDCSLEFYGLPMDVGDTERSKICRHQYHPAGHHQNLIEVSQGSGRPRGDSTVEQRNKLLRAASGRQQGGEKPTSEHRKEPPSSKPLAVAIPKGLPQPRARSWEVVVAARASAFRLATVRRSLLGAICRCSALVSRPGGTGAGMCSLAKTQALSSARCACLRRGRQRLQSRR